MGTLRMKSRLKVSGLLIAFIFILNTSLSVSAAYTIHVSANEAPEDGLCYDLYQIYTYQNIPDDLVMNVFEYSQKAFVEKVGSEGTIVNPSTDADYTGLELNKSYEVEDGVYLLVVRTKENDSTVVKTTTVANATTSISTTYITSLVTCSFYNNRTYITQPMLISGSDDIVLKMTEGPANIGSIRIVKELPLFYNGAENATFVYQVDAYYPTEINLYSSEVYALTFTENGSKEIIVDGLPLDAIVKVTEIYSGATYYSTVAGEKGNMVQVAINHISENDNDVVYFKNIYDGTTKGGGGVTNRFEFVLADGMGQWKWTQVYGNDKTVNGLSDKFLKQILTLGGDN